jgi:DNA topoisomerase VI subunit B
MTAATLQREMFLVSRASEYFDARELQAQTGQPRHRFAAVAVKELVDNALDACETAGVAPEIEIEIRRQGERLVIAVQDNGNGIAPETIASILDFSTRTSDKAAYRSPNAERTATLPKVTKLPQ